MAVDQQVQNHPPLTRASRAGAKSRQRAADVEYLKLCALLRDISVETQNLQHAMDAIAQAYAITDMATRASAIQTAIQQGRQNYDYSSTSVNDRLATVRGLFDRVTHLYSDYGDTVAGIEDDWSKVQPAWPSETLTLSPDEVIARTLLISPLLHRMVTRCCTVTIPQRVNSILHTIRVGQTLRFDDEFQVELPEETDRTEILVYLQLHPEEVNGIVAPGARVIYRVSRRPSAQRLSALIVVGVVLFGFVLIWVFSQLGGWLNLANWPVKPEQIQTLLGVYAFLLLGAFVHIVLDAYKQARTPGNVPLLVLSDWLLWINAKLTPIVWGIVSLWIGFLGLAWSGGLDWKVAFIAGYSIDSVADLYLKRFLTTVQSATTTLLNGVGARSAGK